MTRSDEILALLPATHNEIAAQLSITPKLALAFLHQLKRQGRAAPGGCKREARTGPPARIFLRKAKA